MPKTITQEERQLIKLVEKMHLPDEEKQPWIERIRSGEMSKALADEIREKLAAPAEGTQETEQVTAKRARDLVELSMLVKRWQLNSQSHNFGRR